MECGNNLGGETHHRARGSHLFRVGLPSLPTRVPWLLGLQQFAKLSCYDGMFCVNVRCLLDVSFEIAELFRRVASQCRQHIDTIASLPCLNRAAGQRGQGGEHVDIGDQLIRNRASFDLAGPTRMKETQWPPSKALNLKPSRSPFKRCRLPVVCCSSARRRFASGTRTSGFLMTPSSIAVSAVRKSPTCLPYRRSCERV